MRSASSVQVTVIGLNQILVWIQQFATILKGDIFFRRTFINFLQALYLYLFSPTCPHPAPVTPIVEYFQWSPWEYPLIQSCQPPHPSSENLKKANQKFYHELPPTERNFFNPVNMLCLHAFVATILHRSDTSFPRLASPEIFNQPTSVRPPICLLP